MRRALLALALLGAAPVDETRQALARAHAAADTATREAARLGRAAAEAQARADRSHAARGALANEVRSAEAALATARATLVAADAAQARASDRIAAERRPLAGLVAALLRAARRPPVLASIDRASFAETARLDAALPALRPAIEARAARARRDLAEIGRRRRAAARALAAVAAGQRRLADRRAALATAEMAARGQEADARDGRALALEQAQGQAEQAAALDALAAAHDGDAAAAARLARMPAPLPRPGTAAVPAVGAPAYRLPALGRVLVGAGELSAAGVRARGLTLATAPGTAVIAPAAGIVAYAGAFRTWRGLVIVDHGHGWTTLVAGLVTSAVRAGARVAQGQPLGRAGPRLTLELRHHGRPVDIAGMALAAS